jgi:hypothetical protein
MPLTTEQREKIVAEAFSWARAKTPYRGWSAVKGAGADCGQLLYGVYRNTGHLPEDLPLPTDYCLHVAQHRKSMDYVNTVATYMRQIPESEVLPGDVVIIEIGLAYAHGALIVKWPDCIIHAIANRGVSCSHGTNAPLLRKKRRKFFTLKEEYCSPKVSG